MPDIPPLARRRAAQVPVVPGAFGFGMDTKAAYGGPVPPTIRRVTTLADSGSGSLREALEATEPRVVIFETSGTIVLQRDITINAPFLTVAGQTAPSPGILIRGADDASESAGGINVFTHDVLIQHLRIRPGDGGPVLPPAAAHNALCIYGPYDATRHVVLDHLSLSWAAGKVLQMSAPLTPPGHFCVWRCLVAEGLYHARNVTVSEGDVSSLGFHLNTDPGGTYASVLQSVFAHNADRNPEFGSGGRVILGNNVFYDWGKDHWSGYPWGSFFYISHDAKISFIGNHYVAGPPPHPVTPLIAVGFWSGDNSQFYFQDNTRDETHAAITPFDWSHAGYDPRVTSSPVDLAGHTFMPANTVLSAVLPTVGAWPSARDSVDTRVLTDVQQKTGTVIRSQTEVGGYPTVAVTTRALTPPANPHAVQPSGYTALETWLHAYARQAEGASVPPPTGARLAFDYREADLGTYLVDHFEAAWDGGAFATLAAVKGVLPDTPAGASSYTFVVPFTTGSHTVAIRAVNATGGGAATPVYTWTAGPPPLPLPPAPTHVRPVPGTRR